VFPRAAAGEQQQTFDVFAEAARNPLGNDFAC
jgi:hypothetical protein